MRAFTRRTGGRLAVLLTSVALAPLLTVTPAHADLDRTYCLGWWYGGDGWCSDGSVHSWDYNRIRVTDATAPLCQRLLTSANNVRSGGGCLTQYVWIWSQQYSGGSPLTYAQCGVNLYAWRYIDCLASTP